MAAGITREDLADLVGKYEAMRRMRLEDEARPGGDPRKEMAALAARFPGALRELDEAPLPAIEARLRELSTCLASGGAPSPWMHAMTRFHRAMRGALAAKRWLGASRVVERSSEERFRDAVNGAPFAADALVWATDLARVAAPPGGRLSLLVFERVAEEMGLTIEEVRRLVLE